MTQTHSPLLQPTELAALLARPRSSRPRLRLFDVRPGAAGRAAWEAAHLPGALWIDLDQDLAAITDPARGGRHPLPEPAAFTATLQRLGVSPDDLVVAYDQQGGANAASRLWWMLRSIGHPNAKVLDGGISAAIAAGIEPEHSAPQPPSPPEPAPRLDATSWQWPVASSDEVAAAAADPRRLVLDVRSRERYLGLAEPFDPVAGHIPGASNFPYTENLAGDGRFRSAAQLREQYRDAFGDRLDRAIVHCGSGVTACHTLLAFEAAGLPRPKLYVGSWSEWCRSGREIAVGDEPSPSRNQPLPAPARERARPRAVLFDLGGVVLGSPLHAIAAYERELGVDAGAFNLMVHGNGPPGAWHRLERGELPLGERFFAALDAELEKAGLPLRAQELMSRVADIGKPRPEMLRAIDRLREAGFVVAALTNNWTSEGTSDREFPHPELHGRFEHVVESRRVGLRKPDPEIYRLACRVIGVEPHEVVFLDDIGSNLKSARALGMTTIKVDEPRQALRELEEVVGLALL